MTIFKLILELVIGVSFVVFAVKVNSDNQASPERRESRSYKWMTQFLVATWVFIWCLYADWLWSTTTVLSAVVITICCPIFLFVFVEPQTRTPASLKRDF